MERWVSWAMAVAMLAAVPGCNATSGQWRKSVAALEVEGFMLVPEGIEPGKIVGPGVYVGVVHGKSAGTGFFVDGEGTMITNAHVTRRATRILAKSEDNAMVDVSWLSAVDPACDIAVLKAERPPRISPVRYAEPGQVRKGQPIRIIGNSMNLGLSVYHGRVTNIIEPRKGDLVVVDANYREGASGGPVFDDKDILVGVVVGAVSGTGMMGITVPAWKVAKVVDGTTGFSVDKPVGAFYTSAELNRRLKELGSREGTIDPGDAHGLLMPLEQTRDYVMVVQVVEGEVGFGLGAQPIARLNGGDVFKMVLTAKESGVLSGFMKNLGSEPAVLRYGLAIVDW